MSNPSRVTAGIPTGGQFAATQRAEADVDLGDAATPTSTGATPPGAPDADDLAWAREDIGPDASDDEVFDVAQRRADERDSEQRLTAFREAGFTDANARDWADRNFDPERALNWADAAHSPADASEWTALGVNDPAVASRWRYAGPGTTTPERARPWIEAGFGDGDIDSADAFASFGYTAQEAGNWRAAGFDDVHDANTWENSNYEPMQAAGLRRTGFTPSDLSPTLHRTGETAFKIGDNGRGGPGALYTMRAVPDAQFAEDHGCPGATHMMIGAHETRFGRLEIADKDRYGAAQPRRRKVPGWTAARKGVAVDFVSDNDPDFEPLRGFLGE